MFGQKWKASSTFITCPKLSGSIIIPKVPKQFKHWDFSRGAYNLWAEMKKINLKNHPGQIKIQKLPKMFLSILEKKFSGWFLSSKIFWAEMKIYNPSEIIRQHKNSQTAEFFSSILENISWEFYRVPNIFGQNENFPKFPKAAKTFCIVWQTPQCEQFNMGLN
jgi:hypothetical protein